MQVFYLFFLDYFHSIISSFDVKSFLAYFKKWGPATPTCIKLARGFLIEAQLQRKATDVAFKFARDPAAIDIQALSQESFLFTLTPNDDRSVYTPRASPYFCSLIMKEIAKLDTAAQVSFYRQASNLLGFEETWEYMFKTYFLVWLCSTEQDALSCTATSAKPSTLSKRSTSTTDDQAELRLKPLGLEKVFTISGDSNFQKARDSDTPFGWLPASRFDSRILFSFDAIICTDKNIITIQLTVSSEHAMKPDCFERLKQYLPATFERTRTWCHVFVTDCNANAILLRKRNHRVAVEQNISIYSAVLDVPACKFSPEDVEHIFRPSVCWYKPLYIDFDTYLGVIRTSLLRWTPVGWR